MAKNHLAIDINSSAVRFVKLNGDFVVQEFSFVFTDKQDYRYKAQLDEFWQKTAWKESDFDEVSLSWSDKQSSLIPVNVFNESSKEAIFELSFGNVVNSEVIDYNRLPLQGLVNVFSIPLWVKSFFVIHFPRVVIQHEGTHLIRGVFAGATFQLATKIVLHGEHFLVSIVHENKLKFYSVFDYSTVEDVVYYISYSLQQLNLTQAKNDMVLIAGAGNNLDLEQLQTALSNILKEQVHIKIGVNTLEKYQQLCV